MGLNADQDRQILWVQPLELVGTVMLPVNMLYMRCSEGQWRTGGIKTFSTNPSLQKEKNLEELVSRGEHLLDKQCWELCNPPTECKTSSQKEQKHFVSSFLQDWEASPALVSAAKERTYTCQTFWREFVWMEVKQAESSMFTLFTTEIKGFLHPAPLDLKCEIWPSNLTSKSGLAYTSVSAYGMQIRSSSSSQ